jgi:ATP-dependent exoDNAse (exonuclease V) beta subunit
VSARVVAPVVAAAARHHQVFLASAGSGKTWQLSNRVLRLLLDDVPPERILATTFTRKAAGEILARVLSRLADAAASDEGLAELREALTDEDGVLSGTPFDRARCRALLAQLVRRLDRFQVRTLDSFFSDLARRYGHELGLSPGWTLLDDADEIALRQDAVSAMLDPASGPELGAIVRALHGDAAERSVHERLMDSVETGHAVWLDAQPEAWDALHPPPGLPPAELAALLERLGALEAPLAKGNGKPLKTWEKARDKLVALAEEDRWEKVAGSGLLQHAVDDVPTYYKVCIEGAWLDELLALWQHVAHVLGTRLLRRGHAWRDLLARFHECYEALQAERRGYRFDDLPRRLAAGLSGELSDGSAFFRLHGRVDHLLLDEFQDTSVLQWRVLRPLAESILAETDGQRSFFCVGDVKQAIYAWRQGEARLLSGLPKAYPQLDPPRTLAQSWRSSDVVLDAVNAVFTKLGESPVFADEPALAATATAWSVPYEAHSAANPLPGTARLIEVPTGAGPSGPRRKVMMDATARHVADLAREAPGASIAVLLRKGVGSARLLRALADLGVHASGERGNPLVDSAAVRVALSALHLADHPSDETAWLHLATSPLAAGFGLGPDALDRLAERNRALPDPVASALAARIRAELLAVGYGGWLSDLEQHVRTEATFDAWERGRFGQLVALGLRWDARATLRPSDFLASVRATRVDHPAAAGVRVMTVHAAKGLEFDAVVLPDLDDAMSGLLPDLLAVRDEPQERFARVLPRPKQEHLPLLAEARAVYEDLQSRALEESLCVLYVSMTRAKHRLDLLVQPPDVKPAVSRCYAKLLRDALGEAAEAGPHGTTILWRHADNKDEWWAADAQADAVAAPVAAKASAVAAGAAPTARRPLVLGSAAAPRRPVRQAPSGLAGGRALRAADLLGDDPGVGRTRGSAARNCSRSGRGWCATREGTRRRCPAGSTSGWAGSRVPGRARSSSARLARSRALTRTSTSGASGRSRCCCPPRSPATPSAC